MPLIKTIPSLTIIFLFFISQVISLDDDTDSVVEDDQDEDSTPNQPIRKNECCDEFLNLHYVLISSMDGRITALDANDNGRIMWSIDTDSSPLLSGTLHDYQTKNFSPHVIVPSLDGSLYLIGVEDNIITPALLSADKSVMIRNDALVGGTIVSVAGIDLITGQILYHCSYDSCQQHTEASNNEHTLLIRRSTQRIRAADTLTGQERWNTSVGDYTVNLISKSKVPESSDHDVSSHMFFQMKPPDGEISAVNSCGEELWMQTLKSPIVKVWRVFHGKIHQISLFDWKNIQIDDIKANMDEIPNFESSFYFGTFNSKPYLLFPEKKRRSMRQNLDFDQNQHGLQTTDLVRRHPAIRFPEFTTTDLIKRSYITESDLIHNTPNDRSPRPTNCLKEKSVGLMVNTHLEPVGSNNALGDQGWFALKRTVRNTNWEERRIEPICDSLSSEQPIAKRFVKRIEKKLNADKAVSGWWRICALCFGLIILLSGIILGSRLHRRRGMKAIKNAVHSGISSGSSENVVVEEVLEKKSSNGSIPAVSQPAPTQRTISTVDSQSSTSSFSSKFLEDFVPEKCLGRGGYGIVFKCKNRLDDRNYAVKRIAIGRNSATASERVRREVRAMAKLDHPGIIRYFHTWMEKPPLGWQQEKDKEVLNILKATNTSEMKSIESDMKVLSQSNSVLSSSSEFGNERLAIGVVDTTTKPSFNIDQRISEDTSWASGDGIQKIVSIYESSDSSSDTSDYIPNHPQIDEGESSGIIFVSNSSVKDKCDGDKGSASSDDVFEPPAVLIASKSDIQNCMKTKNYAYLYIQMELCQELTLHNWLILNNEESQRELSKMKCWLAQLVCAVKYIHAQGLIHRDLKPQNIFFSADDNDLHTLKIGDLGLATNMGSDLFVGSSNNAIADMRHTTNVGTRLYMSPEQLAGQVYNEKIDIFSLGLIYTEMLIPFKTVMERHYTLFELQKGNIPSALMAKDRSERDFIKWLTTLDAVARPSCDQISECEYLRNDVHLFGTFDRTRTTSYSMKSA